MVTNSLPISPGIDGLPTNTIPDDPTQFVSWFKSVGIKRWFANADVRNSDSNYPITVTGTNSTNATVALSSAATALISAIESIANDTVVGNVSGSTGVPGALTETQLTALVTTFTPALSGAVPAPNTVNGYFLRDDGSWDPGGSLEITDGSNTVSNITKITFNGATVGGSSPNGTVTVSAAGSGTVTSVATGTGLTGGPITTTGTVALNSASIADLALAATAVQPGTINFIEAAGWNATGGAIVLSLTVPQDIIIPYGCTLQQVYITTQGANGTTITGSCTVTIGTAAFPGSSFVDITGGAPPVISGASSYSNTTLTGWTTSFAQNAQLRVTLSSVSNFYSVKIHFRFQ